MKTPYWDMAVTWHDDLRGRHRVRYSGRPTQLHRCDGRRHILLWVRGQRKTKAVRDLIASAEASLARGNEEYTTDETHC